MTLSDLGYEIRPQDLFSGTFWGPWWSFEVEKIQIKILSVAYIDEKILLSVIKLGNFYNSEVTLAIVEYSGGGSFEVLTQSS